MHPCEHRAQHRASTVHRILGRYESQEGRSQPNNARSGVPIRMARQARSRLVRLALQCQFDVLQRVCHETGDWVGEWSGRRSQNNTADCAASQREKHETRRHIRCRLRSLSDLAPAARTPLSSMDQPVKPGEKTTARRSNTRASLAFAEPDSRRYGSSTPDRHSLREMNAHTLGKWSLGGAL